LAPAHVINGYFMHMVQSPINI